MARSGNSKFLSPGRICAIAWRGGGAIVGDVPHPFACIYCRVPLIFCDARDCSAYLDLVDGLPSNAEKGTIDHFQSKTGFVYYERKKGGEYWKDSNLLPSCIGCNSTKGDDEKGLDNLSVRLANLGIDAEQAMARAMANLAIPLDRAMGLELARQLYPKRMSDLRSKSRKRSGTIAAEELPF